MRIIEGGADIIIARCRTNGSRPAHVCRDAGRIRDRRKIDPADGLPRERADHGIHGGKPAGLNPIILRLLVKIVAAELRGRVKLPCADIGSHAACITLDAGDAVVPRWTVFEVYTAEA